MGRKGDATHARTTMGHCPEMRPGLPGRVNQKRTDGKTGNLTHGAMAQATYFAAMPAENSDVPSPPVAVAVTIDPAARRSSAAENVAFPLPSAFTLSAPR